MANPMCPRCDKPTPMKKGGRAMSGKQRYRCNPEAGGCGYSTTDPEARNVTNQRGDIVKKGRRPPRFIRKLSGVKRLIITAAQNATPVHEGFLAALLAYCKKNDAELIVIPYRYKNPTSAFTASQQNAEWWDDKLVPYLYNQRKKLNDNLMLLGDIKIVPTADIPLSGFEGITKGESGILAHPKVQLRTIATPQSRFPIILTTTGAVTLRNYTDSKAGKKGEFHHVFGAAVVDIQGKRFHLRQINATPDGSFIDLDRQYFADGRVRRAPRPASLTMGDTHINEADPKVLDARAELIELLDPEVIVHHDLLNGRSINHHERKNPFVQLAVHKGGGRDVRREVEEAVAFLKAYGGDRKKIVVPSNHNDWLARWLIEHDWRLDPENAEFYLEIARAVAASAKLTPEGPEYDDAFSYCVKSNITPDDNIEVPGRGSSVMIAGIEHNYHGDKGPSGVRGTITNLSKIGVKLNIGDKHSPAILGPLYCAGTSTFLDPPYTRGHPGSWLNTDILTYANGKRTLVNYIDGAWRFT